MRKQTRFSTMITNLVWPAVLAAVLAIYTLGLLLLLLVASKLLARGLRR